MTARRKLRIDVDPRSVQDSLSVIARSLGMADPATIVGVIARWEQVVGPVLAAQVQPVQIRDKSLWLEVSDPSWSTQVRYLEPEILAAIAEEVGPDLVVRLSVRVKPNRQ
jgi:predicted nucleic acid-binding Zn ribbon protein